MTNPVHNVERFAVREPARTVERWQPIFLYRRSLAHWAAHALRLER